MRLGDFLEGSLQQTLNKNQCFVLVAQQCFCLDSWSWSWYLVLICSYDLGGLVLLCIMYHVSCFMFMFHVPPHYLVLNLCLTWCFPHRPDLIELAVVIAGHWRVVGGFIDLSGAQVVIIVGRTWPAAWGAVAGTWCHVCTAKASKVRGFLGEKRNNGSSMVINSCEGYPAAIYGSSMAQYFLVHGWLVSPFALDGFPLKEHLQKII